MDPSLELLALDAPRHLGLKLWQLDRLPRLGRRARHYDRAHGPKPRPHRLNTFAARGGLLVGVAESLVHSTWSRSPMCELDFSLFMYYSIPGVGGSQVSVEARGDGRVDRARRDVRAVLG